MSESVIALPIATVQPDFEAIVHDVFSGLVPEEKFWLSCYKTGEESVHGKVHLALNESDRNLLDFGGQGGITFEKGSDVSEFYRVHSSLHVQLKHIAGYVFRFLRETRDLEDAHRSPNEILFGILTPHTKFIGMSHIVVNSCDSLTGTRTVSRHLCLRHRSRRLPIRCRLR